MTEPPGFEALLGGSGVVIGVISPLKRFISIVTLLIALLIAAHEPSSRVSCFVVEELGLERFRAQGFGEGL